MATPASSRSAAPPTAIGRSNPCMSRAKCLADAVDNLTEAEVQRARAQLEAGLLMGMESAQGRADQMARSIEVFGRILSTEELLGQLRAVDAARRARRWRGIARRPRRRRLGRRATRTGGVSELTTIVAEPWADWGLIDCGNGQKLERYGDFRVVRPEPQAMWAPARDDWDPDATFVPGSDEEGGGRWVQHRPVSAPVGAGARRRAVRGIADALPPPRLLPRHGAAMGLDAGARGGRRRPQPVRLHRASARCS